MVPSGMNEFCMLFEGMVGMMLITAMVLCTRSQDSILPGSLRRIIVILSTTAFEGEGKTCNNAHVKLPH